MYNTTETIIKQALNLSVEDRSMVIQQLLLSLEEYNDTETDSLWQDEIASRLDDLKSGKVVCISWEDAKSQIAQHLHDLS